MASFVYGARSGEITQPKRDELECLGENWEIKLRLDGCGIRVTKFWWYGMDGS